MFSSRVAAHGLSSALRPVAALSVGAVGVESTLSAATPDRPGSLHLLRMVAPRGAPSLAHLLTVLVGLTLIVLAPSLWKGTRRALNLTVVLLAGVAALNLLKGLDYDETVLDLALMVLLTLARASFILGCAPRPRLTLGIAAVAVWAGAYISLLLGLLVSDRGETLYNALQRTASLGSTSQGALGSVATAVFEAMTVLAVITSLVFVRSLLRPARSTEGHSPEDHAIARQLVATMGQDSLSPFILREDKAFHFHAGGVLAYRLVGDTAVISGDPVGPPETAPRTMASFLEFARGRGWHVVLSGASERHLTGYRALGLRHLHIGNEAIVDPRDFSLEGRRVRKVRQSVHRVERRGWTVDAVNAGDAGRALLGEIAALERVWRAQRRRIVGFAMAMGPWEGEHSQGDLFVLARDPEGRLRALLRFVAHPGGLSLDAMRRLGECPNGLNEALVVRALEIAREENINQVSLNFAGFAHLMAAEAAELEAHRRIARFVLGLLGDRFQMDSLVRFNEKFYPRWQSRFLVYESRARLLRVGLRVLQAEAYLPAPRGAPLERRWRADPRATYGPA